jgi:serine/threonine-protein phosphatase 2A regulatory subunit B''
VPASCRRYFAASVFWGLQKDEFGCINASRLFDFVVRHVTAMESRLKCVARAAGLAEVLTLVLTPVRSLFMYDSTGNCTISESEMEQYITEMTRVLPQLAKLDEAFMTFYVCGAVRKFFFFLDPKRFGRIPIWKLVSSPILAEFLELRNEELSRDAIAANWFSLQTSLRIYGTGGLCAGGLSLLMRRAVGQYLRLDKDQNGMLSRAELSMYADGTLTDTFLDRVFEECNTFGGEMVGVFAA